MIKWMITILVTLFLFAGFMPLLRRFGLGRLPGDFSVQIRGRRFDIPFGTTLLLSALAAGIGWMI